MQHRLLLQLGLKLSERKASAIQQLTGKDGQDFAVLRHLLAHKAEHIVRQLRRIIVLPFAYDRTVQHKGFSRRIQIDMTRLQIDLAGIQKVLIALLLSPAQRQEKAGQSGLMLQDPCRLFQRCQAGNVVQQAAVSIDPLDAEGQKPGDLVRDQHPPVHLVQLFLRVEFSLKVNGISLRDNSIFLHKAPSFQPLLTGVLTSRAGSKLFAYFQIPQSGTFRCKKAGGSCKRP